MNKLYILIILQFIIILVFAYMNITMVTTNEKLNKNPLFYSAEKYDIDFCSCYTDSNANFFFNKTTLWQSLQRISSPEYIFDLNGTG